MECAVAEGAFVSLAVFGQIDDMFSHPSRITLA
jgi:hypothetical protein